MLTIDPLPYEPDDIRRALARTMFADDEPDDSATFTCGRFERPFMLPPIEGVCFDILSDGLLHDDPELTPQRVHKLRLKLAGHFRIINRNNLYRMEPVK